MMKFELIEHTSDDDSQTFCFETSLEDLEIAEVDHEADDEESVRVVFGIERTKKGDWIEVLWVEAERDGDWTICSHVFRNTEVAEVLQELEDVNDEYDSLLITLEELQETPDDDADDF
jgi:ribulose bisphosphate carboxylase small subunit